MILGTVHEAHGTRPANALVSRSGPRVLWTLGGGSKTFLAEVYPHQTPSAGYAAPALRSLWCCKVNRTKLDGICLRGNSGGSFSDPAPGYSPVSDSGRFLWSAPVEPQPPDLGVSDGAAEPVLRSPQ